jgi:hypothetical protein
MQNVSFRHIYSGRLSAYGGLIVCQRGDNMKNPILGEFGRLGAKLSTSVKNEAVLPPCLDKYFAAYQSIVRKVFYGSR